MQAWFYCLVTKIKYNYCMNQLFTFNSEQFTSCLKPAIAKRVLPFEDTLQKRRQQQERGGCQSKKKMKRYQQIVQIASRHFSRESPAEVEEKCQLKSYVAGHFSNIKLNLQPMTMKLQQKKGENMFKSKSKRCNSEMNVNQNDDTMLFTFYPNQPSQTHKQTAIPDNEFTHLEKRSFSMKNAPFVNYPNSNKLLPKVFRSKIGAEDGLRFLRRAKNKSDLAIEEREKKVIQRQFRIDELRNLSNRAQGSTNILKLNVQKIKIPLKRVVSFKKAATQSKIDSQK